MTPSGTSRTIAVASEEAFVRQDISARQMFKGAYHSMSSIKLDVFGRKMFVVESESGWSVFYLGDEGKRRPATDIVVPRDVSAADMVQYLADLCHEWASVRHPHVKRLE